MQALQNKIKQSGLSNAELSIKLGYQKQYITNLLCTGVSTKKQDELIAKINAVMNGEVFKSDADVIAELSNKLANAQDLAVERLVALQHQQTECNNLNNKLVDASKTNKEQYEIITSQTTEIKSLHISAHNDAQAVLELKSNIGTLNNEIELTRETMRKQNETNVMLSDENIKLASRISGLRTELSKTKTKQANFKLVSIVLLVIVIGLLVLGAL